MARCASITRTCVKPADAIFNAGKPQFKRMDTGNRELGISYLLFFVKRLLYASDPFKGAFLLQQERFIIERSFSNMLRQLVLQRTLI